MRLLQCRTPNRKYVLDTSIQQAFTEDTLPNHAGSTKDDDFHGDVLGSYFAQSL